MVMEPSTYSLHKRVSSSMGIMRQTAYLLCAQDLTSFVTCVLDSDREIGKKIFLKPVEPSRCRPSPPGGLVLRKVVHQEFVFGVGHPNAHRVC